MSSSRRIDIRIVEHSFSYIRTFIQKFAIICLTKSNKFITLVEDSFFE